MNVEHNPVLEKLFTIGLPIFFFHTYEDIFKAPGVEDKNNHGRFFNGMTSHLNQILGVNIRNYGLPRPRENDKSPHGVNVPTDVESNEVATDHTPTHQII